MLKYNGGTFSVEIGPRREISTFRRPLSCMNGQQPWALTLMPLPEGADYDELLALSWQTDKFLQAGGSADAMTLEIRRPGGQEVGVESIWGVVGHQHDTKMRRDVAINVPSRPQMITEAEVFAADEAAHLFYAYYTTGNIPREYAVRPIGGWTANGEWVDLGQATN
ncbi:hypothetical protein [Mycolicibacterium doricum]|uniref:hypothetical protein n=1 Tax=Mycolicibacterium doricum TaxID=126673 RepID=UPI001054DF29|nr:hypothetical protein [Mycolicibacterium doricum]MCV7269452.1 hypothetical protein [Mycolicibacterium doricum]